MIEEKRYCDECGDEIEGAQGRYMGIEMSLVNWQRLKGVQGLGNVNVCPECKPDENNLGDAYGSFVFEQGEFIGAKLSGPGEDMLPVAYMEEDVIELVKEIYEDRK